VNAASGDGPVGKYSLHLGRGVIAVRLATEPSLIWRRGQPSTLNRRVMKHESIFYAGLISRDVSRSLSSPDVFAVR
jgi:hypothetical protein